ncbi:MAG: ParB N-terminal domain-containing protein [Acidobacteriaceae bacterium]|nr:ParB N-terminal domain-containing protein [Acidobacteriaceae bacterium]
MTETTSIPLHKLTASGSNVRKTAGADTALAELAASIASHGLLQSLVVRKASSVACDGSGAEIRYGFVKPEDLPQTRMKPIRLHPMTEATMKPCHRNHGFPPLWSRT